MEDMTIIDEKMQLGVIEEVFPGATYAFIHNGEIYTNYVGNKALYPQKESNYIDTIYDLASLTKVVSTNVIIAKLLENGQIKLDDQVKKYLPEFGYEDITIYHLLTHSSGLPADLLWEGLTNKEETVKKVFSKEKEYETGKLAIYSDVGFILLGFIIEKITGKSLTVCAKEKVFEPLDMNDTSYLPTDIERCAPTELQDGIYIRGVVHDEKTRLLNGMSGAAGVFSTITDLTKFINMILNNGTYNGKRFLKKETIDLWFTKEKPTKLDSWRSIGWVCGNTPSICDQTSEDTIFHGGFTGGRLLIDRGNNLAVVFLSNRVHPSRNNTKVIEFNKQLLKIIYDNYVKDNQKLIDRR